MAYRLRLLLLDRAKLWLRLTRYRQWRGPGGERIDGTNHGSERGIGWRIRERYRSMRGYKVAANAERVSRLVCWAGNAGRVGKKARLAQGVAGQTTPEGEMPYGRGFLTPSAPACATRPASPPLSAAILPSPTMPISSSLPVAPTCAC